MIRAGLSGSFEQFVARLTRKALAKASAHAEARTLEQRGNPARWRRAALLWPLFTKGPE